MVRFRGSGLGVMLLTLRIVVFTVLTLGLYLLYVPRALQIWRLTRLEFEGQRARYTGTFVGWIGSSLVDQLLMALSGGLYAPWAIAGDTRDSKHLLLLADGRQLRFDGRGDQIIGLTLATVILMPLTGGLALPWLLERWKLWEWSKTQLSTADGQWRRLAFQERAEGMLGRFVWVVALTLLTLGLYLPWGVASLLRWEADGITYAVA